MILKSCITFIVAIFICADTYAINLRDNLKKAHPGDFIITTQNKCYSLFHVYAKGEDALTIEEITAPTNKIPQKNFAWREWVRQGAPGQTNWIIYTIKLSSGAIQECYSVSRKGWYDISQWDNFLPTLLNLQLTPIAASERKKVGPPPNGGGGPDWRTIWHPKMMVDGKPVPDVKFNAWVTHWPKDSSVLSGRTIEIYTPEENDKYPSYFPYWLQIKGAVGGATIRIVDSGSGLTSPAQFPKG